MVRSPARKALITKGTRARTHFVSSAVSWPCSCAAPSPAACTASTTRWGASFRNTPTVRMCSGRRFAMSLAVWTGICRGEGANMKPTAEAPRLTASRPSASEVIPQILTNSWSFTPSTPTDGVPDKVTQLPHPVTGAHEGLSHEDGVVPAFGQPPGVVGVTDPGLGHGDDIERDRSGQRARSLVVH